MRTLATRIAMLWPVGLLPGPRATYGSAVVVIVGWFLPVPALGWVVALLALGAGLAIWSAGEAEHVLGHDANPIIIDEVIGQSLALLWTPHTIGAFALAFILFRFFDVLKPFGAREVERLPGGYGVVADDAIAGVVSCVTLQLLRLALQRLGLAWLG